MRFDTKFCSQRCTEELTVQPESVAKAFVIALTVDAYGNLAHHVPVWKTVLALVITVINLAGPVNSARITLTLQ